MGGGPAAAEALRREVANQQAALRSANLNTINLVLGTGGVFNPRDIQIAASNLPPGTPTTLGQKAIDVNATRAMIFQNNPANQAAVESFNRTVPPQTSSVTVDNRTGQAIVTPIKITNPVTVPVVTTNPPSSTTIQPSPTGLIPPPVTTPTVSTPAPSGGIISSLTSGIAAKGAIVIGALAVVLLISNSRRHKKR